MKDYQKAEWEHMVNHAQKTLTSSCPLIEDEVIVAVSDELNKLRERVEELEYYNVKLANESFSFHQENEALQAKLDALMLEFCPDEMTPEQLENWKKCLKMSIHVDLAINKIKADAVREAAEYLESCQSTSKTDFDLLSDYADKIERGEE